MTEPGVEPQKPGLETLISRIAAILRGDGPLSAGDVAALRRMSPQRVDASFLKLASISFEGELPAEPDRLVDQETRWAAIVVGLAHFSDLHDPTRRLGTALVAAEFSELRFTRLLQSDADRLLDEIPRLGRFLAAKGVPANWTDAARLLLSSGRRDEERTRRNIARDYYAALSRRDS